MFRLISKKIRRAALVLGALALAAGIMISSVGNKSVQAIEATATVGETGLATVRHQSMKIQGIDIAYREAGDPTKPTVVLLHGSSGLAAGSRPTVANA